MKTLILLADGFEETEAVAIIDVLRRADIVCDLAAIGSRLMVTGDHGITLQADLLLDQLDPDADYEAVITPGGMPGTLALRDNPKVIRLLQHFAETGKIIASICASPLVLEATGLTAGRSGTSFPSVKDQVNFANYSEALVVEDGQLITSRGPATALLMGLELVAALKGKELRDQLAQALLIPELKAGLDSGTY